MEAFKPGLEICSSTTELSRFDGASTSEQAMNRIKIERASYQCNLEIESRTKGAEMAANKSLILGFSSSQVNLSCKGKAVLCSSNEIEELNERMRILEEETESMKQELFEGAEERRKLINEIYQQFQILTRELKFNDGSRSETSSQDKTAGSDLSDDLRQDLAHTLSVLLLTQ
ncbi:hypothetical protein RchiOBHm_Chr2g0134481 [Rosa chinensis]|uniref:Uncharacterized protein n=1 Tax=Rosa chinensis TaxID=74649 RepID=A0A2P6RVU8_ROSCH|nr:uncharacterized protein LOC112190866 [Rosa chinensis]XP_024186141.1 uncharacterized protein LOC112190866 [Rosa chinensis]XP_024186142.1 uncharacterized protein LOC112190866 [Rosa chinensis]XP_040369322.1 uncharacterized protein LOC112190866 [Rosa chinensis]PRQ50551.1 hypothetical protein RchiOBHm_Chr2g0134481 [Rosa chinensis]